MDYDAAAMLVPPTIAAALMVKRRRDAAAGTLTTVMYVSWVVYVISKTKADFGSYIYVFLASACGLFCLATVVEDRLREGGVVSAHTFSFVQGPATLCEEGRSLRKSACV